MRRLSEVTIDTKTIVTAVSVVFLFVALISFAFTLFRSFIQPFFLEESTPSSTLTLDASFDEVVEYLKNRGGRQDLTAAPPSATLTEGRFTAEVTNGSGIAGAARTLADALESLGITVSQIGNTEREVANTVIALKAKAEILRGSIVEKIGTKSAELRFEKLEDTYPFDIRIVIGR